MSDGKDDAIRIRSRETLSENWYKLEKVTFDQVSRDGSRQTLARVATLVVSESTRKVRATLAADVDAYLAHERSGALMREGKTQEARAVVARALAKPVSPPVRENLNRTLAAIDAAMRGR